MAWLEIKFDLGRVASALERIADAVERAYPPIREIPRGVPAPPENLTVFDPEKECQLQEEEDRQEALGLRVRRRS